MSVPRNRGAVKRREYDARGRQAAAQLARTAVLDAAWQRFSADGFAVTTVEVLADDAGVSTATIYKGFGGKAGIVRALVTRALEGDPAATQAAEVRSDMARETVADGRELVAAWGRLMTEVAPRVAPILLLLRDVAPHDPAAASLFAELERDRLTRMADNARVLHRLGALRNGVTRATARDIMWSYTAPDLYDVLVRRRGWSVRRYATFATDGIVAALL